MIHIAIEGMDGVGKTTVCKLLASKTGYTFITKPLHYLLDLEENVGWPVYFRVRNMVNNSSNRDFSAWFYGLSNIYLYEKFKNQNIITDRHIVSNYCWSGNQVNLDIYDLIIKKIGFPTLTVILYADEDTIRNRLIKRNSNDKDLKRISKTEKVYEKMISFCELKHFPYIVIDTSKLSPEQITNIIIKKLEAI
ncbi:MAG: AAA family ATPase [Mollicutes bacterium]|nr:AAA family ATPase [Mollicutes bacterium]